MPEQHETNGPPMERPSNPLMALTFGLYRPDDADLAGVVTYGESGIVERLANVAKAVDRIANYCQGLPTRDDYDAMLAEHAFLREKVARLELLLDRFVRQAAA